MGKALFAALALAAFQAGAASPAKVSFLDGQAEKESKGGKSKLSVGAALEEQDWINTSDDARLEIKFADDSTLRIGPSARVQLTAAHFGRRPEQRKMTARLLFGRLWAKVTSAVRGERNFAIETENAVAGVRGTTFRVDAREDKSVLVRVYDGSVAVARNVPIYQTDKPGQSPGERREVPGPDEVTREQWEHLVGRQMEIEIAADGTPLPPARFDPSTEGDDDWVQWNQKRDAARKK